MFNMKSRAQRKRFDLSIKFDDQPIFKCKRKSLEDLEDTIKTLKQKMR